MQNCLGINWRPARYRRRSAGSGASALAQSHDRVPLVGDGRGELLPGDKLAQVVRIVVRQQADHIVAGIENKLANGTARSGEAAELRGGFLNVRVKLRADKIGDPLGAGEVYNPSFEPK